MVGLSAMAKVSHTLLITLIWCISAVFVSADFTPWCESGQPSHHVPSTHTTKSDCEAHSACVWAWQRQVGGSQRQCVMKKDCSGGCTYSGAGCYINTDLRLQGTALDCSFGGLDGALDITNTPAEVEYIYLDHNAITTVSKRTLDPMRDPANPESSADPVLRWLSLDHNDLTEIPDGLFDGLTKLNLPVYSGAFDDGGHLVVTLEGNPTIADAPKAVEDGPPSVIDFPQNTALAADEATCNAKAGTHWTYTGNGNSKKCYIKRISPSSGNGGTYQGLGCQKRGTHLHCEKRGLYGNIYIDNMPSDIVSVDFRWNHITHVDTRTWSPVYATLQRVWFDYNYLEIHDTIFSDLAAVTDIRLQHNPIAVAAAILRGPPFIIPLPQDSPVAVDMATCNAQAGTVWTYTKGKCLYHTVSDGTCQVTYDASDDALDPMVDQLTLLPTSHSGGRNAPTHDAKDKACMLLRSCGSACKYEELGCAVSTLVQNNLKLLDCSGRGISGAVNINNVPSDTFKIDLSFNDITSVSKATFAQSSALKYIDMSYNSINTLVDGQFDDLPHVKGVRLLARTQGQDANNVKFRLPIATVSSVIKNGPQQIIQLPQDSPIALTETSCDAGTGTHWGYNGGGNTEAERKASKQCWLSRECASSGCTYEGLGCRLESRGKVLNCAAKGIKGDVYITNSPATVKTFRFSYNAITSVDERTWSGNSDIVTEIDLDYNFLTVLGDSGVQFKDLIKLEALLLNDNSINDLGDSSFDNLPKLRSMYLTNNPIATVSGTAAVSLRSGITLPKASLDKTACDAQPGTKWTCPYYCFDGHYNNVDPTSSDFNAAMKDCLPCPYGMLCSGDMHNSPFPWSSVMHKQTACCLAEAHTTGDSRCCSLIVT